MAEKGLNANHAISAFDGQDKNSYLRREASMAPDTLEGLKDLLGENHLPKTEKELNWLLQIIQDAIRRNGLDWVKENREAVIRQWEYCASLL